MEKGKTKSNKYAKFEHRNEHRSHEKSFPILLISDKET